MTKHSGRPPVFGITGFKNSGKTTLTTQLVETLTARGYRVATIKHAHHDFKIDDDETDSARHRRAGAAQVAIVSSRRWAIVTELEGRPEPTLEETIERFDAPDLVLVEGYKNEPIPKIECRRKQTKRDRGLADDDPMIIAVAADYEADTNGRPLLDLNSTDAITDLIVKTLGIAAKGQSADHGG